MTGSTLYRRLPNGSWASQREDADADGVGDPAAAAAAGAAPTAGPSAPPGQSEPTIAQPTPKPSRRRRRWRFWRILRWAIAAYLIWLLVLCLYAGGSVVKIEALSPDPIAPTEGSVWLLVGSDSREGMSAEEQKELHTGDTEGQRTDTIMLIHQELGKSPTLVSIPRDSWVTIPAHTASDGTEVGEQRGKINASFAYGGAPLLSQTIEYNTGLHVDHYMEVGMQGIVAMTDAVGGIEVCFEEAITDENSGLDVEAGCQTLNGEEALAWVRMRYADPKGDLGRIERQRQYMALMVDELISWQTLLNPFRQWAIVNAALESVVVDTDTGVIDLGAVGIGMGRLAAGSGEVTTVPIDESDHWESGQWVIKWDPEESDELFTSIGGREPQSSSEG